MGIGPYGAVAAGSRAAWGLGPAGGFAGTRYVSAASLRSPGGRRPGRLRLLQRLHPRLVARYPGAWLAAGWAAGTAWNSSPGVATRATWAIPRRSSPIYYDYGNTVTYQEGQVYYDDQPVATEAEYAQQATQIAEAGRQAQPAADDSWQPLGVFAMARGDETTSNDIFQLALNQAGTVRGNYYNALSDSTQPVSGSLDKTSQRVAWTIGDRKEPVYETGLYNLTQEETTLLVHSYRGPHGAIQAIPDRTARRRGGRPAAMTPATAREPARASARHDAGIRPLSHDDDRLRSRAEVGGFPDMESGWATPIPGCQA